MGGPVRPTWTFLSNYAHVLLCIAKNPDTRVRDIAVDVGITQRAVARILTELETAGVVDRERKGRRNHYTLRLDAPLRHPLESHSTVGDLLGALER
ncbi:MAG: winged helix-turn-helix domain-containing protein [Myxococcota bacterium]